ncbi:MAG: sigma-70 family RNA polymerase sigma factor [Bacteroidota bacterium]
MKEEEIIAGCQKLEEKYQRALVKQFSGQLYTVCRRYCGDDFSAKEALQEGLIRIFKYIDKFDSTKGSFLGWMKRIVTNEALKVLKVNGKMRFIEIQKVEIVSHGCDAISNLHEEELLQLVQQLPGGYREVFNLFVIDGYTHNEIAEMLGITSSTSRSQLVRAKKVLQQKISMIENLQLCRKNG